MFLVIIQKLCNDGTLVLLVAIAGPEFGWVKSFGKQIDRFNLLKNIKKQKKSYFSQPPTFELMLSW